ncbi:MAG: ETC complex I subunit [Alphaproteobacteria bacterium]|nr:MAG: ETC complex I subunit [Alphaproteobacteria bacterium]
MSITPDSPALSVRIVQPTGSAMQSGRRGRSVFWTIQPVTASPTPPDPLMGWPQSGTTMGELYGRLRFSSAEQAVDFAVRQGWTYEIQPHQASSIGPKNYLQNFKTTEAQ